MTTERYSDNRGISLASGTGPILIDTSGEFIKISGQSIYISSGTGPVRVATSGQAVKISGETVTAKISGQTVAIAGGVNISGQPVKVSGETVAVASGFYGRARISGDTIIIAGGVNVSGAPVKVSGEWVETHIMSGSGISVSGSVVILSPPTAVRARPVFIATDESGGTILLSGDCKAAMLKSLSADVWIGGTTTPDLPYSGNGMLLAANGVISLDIDNFNNIRICANVSGSGVSYIGIV